MTVAVAIIAIFILPDFPTTTTWLTPAERELAITRMSEDAGIGDESETELDKVGDGFWQAVKDWKVWWLGVALTGQVNALSFNAFFPTLTATLGFDRTISLVLVAPPFILAAICAFVVSQ